MSEAAVAPNADRTTPLTFFNRYYTEYPYWVERFLADGLASGRIPFDYKPYLVFTQPDNAIRNALDHASRAHAIQTRPGMLRDLHEQRAAPDVRLTDWGLARLVRIGHPQGWDRLAILLIEDEAGLAHWHLDQAAILILEDLAKDYFAMLSDMEKWTLAFTPSLPAWNTLLVRRQACEARWSACLPMLRALKETLRQIDTDRRPPQPNEVAATRSLWETLAAAAIPLFDLIRDWRLEAYAMPAHRELRQDLVRREETRRDDDRREAARQARQMRQTQQRNIWFFVMALVAASVGCWLTQAYQAWAMLTGFVGCGVAGLVFARSPTFAAIFSGIGALLGNLLASQIDRLLN